MHLFPCFQFVELDLLEFLPLVVIGRQDGAFSPYPLDDDARILFDLSFRKWFPLFYRPALEEEPQLLVFVQGSRGAAHNLPRDGVDREHRDRGDCQRKKEKEGISHRHCCTVLLCVFVFVVGVGVGVVFLICLFVCAFATCTSKILICVLKFENNEKCPVADFE